MKKEKTYTLEEKLGIAEAHTVLWAMGFPIEFFQVFSAETDEWYRDSDYIQTVVLGI